jgi:hypothetical protein
VRGVTKSCASLPSSLRQGVSSIEFLKMRCDDQAVGERELIFGGMVWCGVVGWVKSLSKIIG